MPIKVPDNLPALDDLLAEQVDVMAQKQALRQDIEPLRLLLLNLMPKKRKRRFSSPACSAIRRCRSS